MQKNDLINKHNLTKEEKSKLLKIKASPDEVKLETQKVLAQRLNAIKNLSGK